MFGIEKGFDIVIGNPPYGAKFSKIEKQYFLKSYKHQDYQLDSYLLFTEKSFLFTKSNGLITLIIPNTWLINLKLKKIRKFLTKQNTVVNVSHYYKGVFEAVVDTQVVILKKSNSKDTQVKIRLIDSENEVKQLNQLQQNWKMLNGEPINIFADKKTYELANKIKSNKQTLATVCKIVSGLTPYRKGYGKPKQTKEIIENRVYDSDRKVDESFRPILRGRDIEKYINKWDGKRWIKFGDNLAEPRYSANFDAEEKILIRQTGDKLIAILDTEQFVCLKNMHVITENDTPINLRLMLALLNSEILDFYHQFLNPEKGEALAEIKKENVGKLPIPKATNEQQTEIAEIVDKIIEAKKQDANADTKDWEDEIDDKVYKLYGLTDEEIAIVEGKNQRSEFTL